jgi:hypothetical protein
MSWKRRDTLDDGGVLAQEPIAQRLAELLHNRNPCIRLAVAFHSKHNVVLGGDAQHAAVHVIVFEPTAARDGEQGQIPIPDTR